MLNPISDDGTRELTLRCPECTDPMEQDEDGFFCPRCQPSAEEMEEAYDDISDFNEAAGAYVEAWVWVERRTKRTPTVGDYRKWAKQEFHDEGRIEVDDNARVSDSGHESANT